MNTSRIRGQRIVEVKQTRLWNPQTNSMTTDVNYIKLENGVKLLPVVEEGTGEYYVDFQQIAKAKGE